MSDDRLFPSERDLDAFWNALVRGEDRLDAAGPARDDADQVRRLHSLLHAHPPAGADERLRRGVMAELARQRAHSNGMETSMNGIALGAGQFAPLVPPRPIVVRPARPLRQPWWERGASLIGVAALIIAMIGGVFFTFNGSRDERLPAVVASPSAVATPAAAAGDWPTGRGNPARTGATDQPGPTGPFGVRWTFSAPAPLNAPMVAGGTVYTASEGGIVYAIDAATGQQRWSFDMKSVAQDDTNYPTATVGPDALYIASSGGMVYALDRAEGTVRWSFQTKGPLTSSPALDNGALFIGDQSGTLRAFDAASGAVRWSAALGQALPAAPAIADGLVYQVDAVGKVSALDENTGKVRWSVTFSAYTRSPAVSGGFAYLGSNDGHLYALDAKTGTERWRYTAPAGTSVNNATVAGGLVVFNVETVSTVALDAATGAPVWSVLFAAGGRPPVLAASVAYVVDAAYQVLALDLATGQRIGGASVGGTPELMAVAGGVLYLGDRSGKLTAFVTGAATPASASTAAATPTTPAAVSFGASHLWTAIVGEPGSVGSIAFAPDGSVWALGYSGSFWILDRDGNPLGTWGTPGSGPGQFAFRLAGQNIWAGDLKFAADGSFFVAECGNARVEKFDAQRKLVMTIGAKGQGQGQFICPTGLVIGKNGDIFVSDSQRGDIQRFAADGTFVASLGSFPGPTSLSLDGKGDIIVPEIDGNQVQVIAPDGKPVLTFGALGYQPGELNGPIAAVTDENGNFYVAETFNARISVFDPTGKFIGIVDPKLAGPDGFGGGMTALAYGGHGSLYAAGFLHSHVEKFMVTAPAAPTGTPTP